MLKVLHFYKTYYPDSFGGIEQVIFQLSEGGVAHGIQSDVLSLSPRGHIQNQRLGSHMTHCEAVTFELGSTPFSFAAIRRFKELAKHADVIHYHFPFPFMDMVHFISGTKKPTVVSYHSDIVKQKTLLKFYTPLMDFFLSRVDHIVAASPNYVSTSPTLQKHIDKVSVIPYGLDKNSYPSVSQESLNAWRARIGAPFFLFIGAFRYYKGLHILIEAAMGAPYPIVIVGAGPIEDELKQQAKRLGLTNIHFLGAVPDVDKVALLMLCYGIVFPSHLRSEAFGISLLEGAMMEKPLISSEIGTGTTFINIHNETGLVVPPSDASALRAAMDTLWNAPELAGQFGKNASARFEKMFTSEQMVEKYAEIYKGLLTGSPSLA
ncbi:glycosyltransferase family 4 protein [Sodalis sp. RH16]|uniref:glycosyltransferase family 4 protein n=1 Tax=unclassified Sodalis (in: enterobacteria) TaxID=2636512 RepID=UPI0039B59441